jgi:vancomycin resistance protein YoaR
MDEPTSETSTTVTPADGQSDAALDEPTAALPATEDPPGDEPEAPAADAPPDGGDDPPRRWLLPVAVVPIVLLVVLVIAWAVDTSSGGVRRNVTLDGEDIGNQSEAELAASVADLAERWEDAPVEVVALPAEDEPTPAEGEPAPAEGDAESVEPTGPDDDERDPTDRRSYRTTAAELGLSVDEDRTVERALDVGDDAFVLLRPFDWAASFLRQREAPVVFRVSQDQVATSVVAIEGEDRVPATEPTVELVDGEFRVVPGRPGVGIDPADVAEALPEAAAARATSGAPIRVEVRRQPIPPLGSDAEAAAAAASAEALVAEPVEIQTSAGARAVSSERLRTWVTLSTAPDGTVAVDLDPTRVGPGLRDLFEDIAGGPVDARFTIEGGRPVIIPEQTGKVCCADDSSSRIITALRAGTRAVALDLVDAAPSFTAAEAAGLGIVEEVGAPDAFGPTTRHACCESRVENIHRIADLIRGVVIKPGETFSVNDHVGRRTVAKGFTEGGAISGGRFTTGIGGGISQFATTFFNAALFAGLDFGEYQSHSLYISRYPRGREATLSFPHPDLQIKNTTPYGVLVWPTYTDTSITVHLYSTRNVEVNVGEPSPSPAGNCTRWTVPRTRTYADGRVVQDSVFARYRPREGVNC